VTRNARLCVFLFSKSAASLFASCLRFAVQPENFASGYTNRDDVPFAHRLNAKISCRRTSRQDSRRNKKRIAFVNYAAECCVLMFDKIAD
jgi:hypothetical protein